MFTTSASNAEVARNIAKYFNGAKVCDSPSQTGCSKYYYDIKYATTQLNDDGNNIEFTSAWPAIILNNGAIIGLANNKSGCEEKEYTKTEQNEYGQTIKDENGKPITSTYKTSICANIFFDVNGAKLPNQFGRDVYYLWVEKDHVVPCHHTKLGGNSFKNILTGKDILEYVK